jgi:membrane-associated phospholipid phosphatase
MKNIEKKVLTFVYVKRIFVVALIYLMHTALYNYVSVHHVNDNFNLLTDLDKLFPFIPGMVYLYVSFYIVIVLSVFFLRTEESFDRIIASIMGTLLFTYPLFYFFPANYPVPSFEANTFTTKLLKWCFAADVPNNTFPSLHVSLSFTLAFGIKHYRKKLGMLYLIWAIGIALSTLMIRKHFLIDSFSGIVMATFSYNLFVSGKLTKTLFDTIEKIKHYLAYLIENNLNVKRVSRNLIYLLVTILRMK